MKTAYSISLSTSVRKTDDASDKVNSQVFINRIKYFRSFGKYVPVRSLATPMTQMAAMQLADQLKSQTDQIIEIIEVLADDDAYLPANLEELNPVKSQTESVGLQSLKKAVEQCFRDGMNSLDILSAANKAVING
jgi:hypothetical protein